MKKTRCQKSRATLPSVPFPQIFFEFSFEFAEMYRISGVSDATMRYQCCQRQCQSCQICQGISDVSYTADAEPVMSKRSLMQLHKFSLQISIALNLMVV
jgi:hypothetical protein